MDFTTLSLAEVRSGLEEMARDTQATFGSLNAQQLCQAGGDARAAGGSDNGLLC